jgi:transcription elongation factor GreA
MQKEPLTKYGYDKLIAEIEELKSNQRPETVIELDYARSLGDLKENAEYHAAKEKLALIDKRLSELADLYNRVQLIDPSTLPHERVSFGSTVKVLDLDTDEPSTYTIVGSIESNVERGYISFNAPLAKQLLGKQEGDAFSAVLPSGKKEFEIEEISYQEIVFDEK